MDNEAEILKRLEALESRVQKLEVLLSGATSTGESGKLKKVSIREFLLTKNAKSSPELALALGYFLEHMKSMPSFNVTDLEGAFREAKIPPPKNINDAVYQCIKRGFMMEAAEKKDSKKAWCLTTTGEQHVSNELVK